MNRQMRERVARTILIMMVSIGAPLALWGFWWEPDQAVRRVTLALPGWPLTAASASEAVMSGRARWTARTGSSVWLR